MESRDILLPPCSLVALIGVTGAGKTTFAKRNFPSSQVLSSDFFRILVADDENSMEASTDAFDVLYSIARKRLSRGLSTVIDATNLQDFARANILALAAEFDAATVALVLDVPREISIERTLRRPDRPFGAEVVLEHYQEFQETIAVLETEGFAQIHYLRGVPEITSTNVRLSPAPVTSSPEECPSLSPPATA